MKRIIMTLAAVVLTARMGVLNNPETGLKETWYNLDMSRVVRQTDTAMGMTNMYNVRSDGVKCYGPYVIVAADLNVHPRYSLVETSLGTGVVLDAHTTDSGTIDIATNWGKGGKK